MKTVAAILASVSAVVIANSCSTLKMAPAFAALATNPDIKTCSSDSGFSLIGLISNKSPTPEQYAKILTSPSCQGFYSAAQKVNFPDCSVNGKPVSDISTLPMADGLPMLISAFVPSFKVPSTPADPPAPTTAPGSGTTPTSAPTSAPGDAAPSSAPGATPTSAPGATPSSAPGDAPTSAPADDSVATAAPAEDGAATPDETIASDMNATVTEETPAEEANTTPDANAKDNAAATTSSMMVASISMTVAALTMANVM